MIFNPDSIDLSQFDYHLPNDKIALYPLEERSKSKLLIANAQNYSIESRLFEDIVNYLHSGSLICVNSTKVIQARLPVFKPSGGKVELLLISPISPSIDPQITLSTKATCQWECFVGGRNIKINMVLSNQLFNDFRATIINRDGNRATVRFECNDNLTFSDVLKRLGKIPLPPYINRDTEESDENRYQTVYSNALGSVAAPTAGLHFTNEMIERLKCNNISFANLLLHIGPGTFKPIDSTVASHDMHSEQFFVDKDTIQNIIRTKENGSNLIATGTTSLRTMETLYWIGMKIYYQDYQLNMGSILLDQFEAYFLSNSHKLLNLQDSLNSIICYMDKQKINNIFGETKLFILPGYEIQAADCLITNFHLPKSTLLMLVSAFIGDKMRKQIYNYALNNEFRFLSYGDASLLIR